MRKLICSIAMIGMFVIALPVLAAPPLFVRTEGFATKVGFRGVFAWQAAQPVRGLVRYGTTPDNLNKVAQSLVGSPDTAAMAIAEGLTVGSTYYWKVEDQLTREASETKSFKAANAYNDWDAADQVYTIDLLVQLDAQSLPDDVPYDMALNNISQGVSIFAERLYDAMDGYARIGDVIVTDTNLDYSANQNNPPTQPPPVCQEGNYSDVLVQTQVPFDSHTWSGWSISRPCVSFYVGRIGQLVVPWGDTSGAEDLHFGIVSAHEMMHYAFNAPDLYSAADINNPRASGCWNLAWDGSLMHNTSGWNGSRWELTELDRSQALTPCDHQFSGSWTWQELRNRYTEVPDETVPPTHVIDEDARGNEDGGALNIMVLDREPGASTLTSFTPSDENPPEPTELSCTSDGPVATDAAEDATSLANANGVGPNEPALDLREQRLDWNASTETLTFTTKVTDLGAENPGTAPLINYTVDFDYEGRTFYVEAFRSSSEETFSFGELVASPRVQLAGLEGTFDATFDTITISLPNSVLDEVGVKPFVFDDELTNVETISRRAYSSNPATTAGAVADRTQPGCPYTIGRGAVPKPVTVEPDGYITLTSPSYDWEGDILVDAVAPFTGFNEPSGCDGTATSEGCERRRIHVTPDPGGSPLKFVVETDDPNSSIVNVYGPDGKLWASRDGLGTPEAIVEGTATQTGIYTVVIRPWAAVAEHYTGRAYLGVEPDPTAEATLNATTPSYGWSGGPFTEIQTIGQVLGAPCTGPDDESCDLTRVNVDPGAGADLRVTITAEDGISDFDLTVFDPSGTEINHTNDLGDESFSARVTTAGVYTIAVRTFNGVDASYDGAALLDFSAPPPPPPSGDFEAEIFINESYSWQGDPPVDANLALTCASLVSPICDNTSIKVNIPAGGGKLKVTVNADSAGDTFRFYIYDPAGTQTSGGSSPGTYTMNVTAAQSGIFRIGVTAAPALGTYSASITLVP